MAATVTARAILVNIGLSPSWCSHLVGVRQHHAGADASNKSARSLAMPIRKCSSESSEGHTSPGLLTTAVRGPIPNTYGLGPPSPVLPGDLRACAHFRLLNNTPQMRPETAESRWAMETSFQGNQQSRPCALTKLMARLPEPDQSQGKQNEMQSISERKIH